MPLFIWTHHALGKNWSVDLVIKEEHTLITSGPYRWVRHPMYTSFFVQSLAFFLLSANWVIGLAGLATSVLGASRVDKEEALMIEEFGDQYRAYMQRTGRFLPPMKLKRI
jgi:protein-S-isoprenylcysteine O-methyltransferase Ste14